jgi:hypothetical protein
VTLLVRISSQQTRSAGECIRSHRVPVGGVVHAIIGAQRHAVSTAHVRLGDLRSRDERTLGS